MDIEIRPATPEDVDVAVPLIYSSGSHEFDYGFATRGHRATDWTRAAFLGRSTTESHRAFHVALVGGRVVGIGSFLGGAAFDTANALRFAWEVARFFGPLECPGVLRRTLRLMDLMPAPGADALFIRYVGVSEGMRGQGLGTVLLEEQLRMAREAGFRRAVLDVAVTNSRAQLLYERLGFRVTGERSVKTRGSAIDVPQQRRMELLL